MINTDYTTLQTPLRTIKGKVELLGSSTTFSHTDALKSFKIERLGESGKFFGFGINQKLTVELLDKERAINLADNTAIMAYLATNDNGYLGASFETPFYIKADETKRDEKTNALTIVAYDTIREAAAHTFDELGLVPPYSIADIARACAGLFGCVVIYPDDIPAFNLVFEDGANVDGTETLREILDDIAEVTQTIYYVYHDELTFKRLSTDNEVLTIRKEDYFEADGGAPVTLAAICSTTELGDNITATGEATGITQYIRDNALIDLREDRAELLEAAVAALDGLTIQQFSCKWRGNYFLEIGDKIEIEAKDGSYITSYLLNDVLEYNGSLKQNTEWQYSKQEETASNPSTLGEILKQTYAKVDKANKQIEMVASETSTNAEAIAALQIDTDSISATVSSLQTETKEALEANTEDITILKNSVSAQMTPEAVTLQIQQEIANGVGKVETSTGFTFDENGLTVDKTDSEMKTTITEDGMTVYKNDEAVLVADNIGVNAKNLNALTYLIVGTNSRFENYGTNRTGCFWIGG